MADVGEEESKAKRRMAAFEREGSGVRGDFAESISSYRGSGSESGNPMGHLLRNYTAIYQERK